jgi:hypothetical protein
MTEEDTMRITRLEERLRAHEQMHGARIEEILARLRHLERAQTNTTVTMLIAAAGSAGLAATLAAVLVRVVR